jgi:hypothetical protein
MIWLIVIGSLIAIAVIWWFVFRLAMRDPNDEGLKGKGMSIDWPWPPQ